MGNFALEDLGMTREFIQRSQFTRRARAAWDDLDPHIARSQRTTDAHILESGGTAHVLEYFAALSRALGIRISSPLLDARIAEFAATTPLELRRSCAEGRSLLRRAFLDVLPAEIGSRTNKKAFCPDALTTRLSADRIEQAAACLRIQANIRLRGVLDPAISASGLLRMPLRSRSVEGKISLLFPVFVAKNLAAFLNHRKHFLHP